jgi:hypothetical protein
MQCCRNLAEITLADVLSSGRLPIIADALSAPGPIFADALSAPSPTSALPNVLPSPGAALLAVL